MTPTTFRAAGEALYGPRWRVDLAAALGVNRRTIARWANGENPIPDGSAELIRRELARRRGTIDKLLAA